MLRNGQGKQWHICIIYRRHNIASAAEHHANRDIKAVSNLSSTNSAKRYYYLLLSCIRLSGFCLQSG
jgi:hypothetical protein